MTIHLGKDTRVYLKPDGQVCIVPPSDITYQPTQKDTELTNYVKAATIHYEVGSIVTAELLLFPDITVMEAAPIWLMKNPQGDTKRVDKVIFGDGEEVSVDDLFRGEMK